MYIDDFLTGRLAEVQEFATVLSGSPVVGAELVAQAILATQDQLRTARDLEAQYAIVRAFTVRAYLSEGMRLDAPVAADIDNPHPVVRPELENWDDLDARFAASSKLQRALLLLRYSEGLSDQFIAHSVGSTPEAISTYFARVLTRLGVDPSESPGAGAHSEQDLRRLIEVLGDYSAPSVEGLRERVLAQLPDPRPEPEPEPDLVLDPEPEAEAVPEPEPAPPRRRVSLADLVPARRSARAGGLAAATDPSEPAADIGVAEAAKPGLEWRIYERYLARTMVFLLGFRIVFHFGATYGEVLALVTVPLWISGYRRHQFGVPVAVLGVVTAGWGLVLRHASATDHAVNGSSSRDTTVLFVGMLMAIGVVLWARGLLRSGEIGACFGFGMLAAAAATPSEWGTNPWKYSFGIAVTILVLGAVAHVRRAIVPIAVLVVLAVVSVVLDSRAFSATLALCAVLVFWRFARQASPTPLSRLRIAGLIGALGVAIYFLASSLLVNGYLGRDAQQRSIAQIHSSGSLLLGGRPELAATLSLIHFRPSGYGTGVVPSPNDILVAKAGLSSINYAPNNGYVDKFMFGGHFELHSVLGDMWANWGLLGLALLAGIVVIAVRSIVESVAGGAGNVLTILVCCWTLWNLGFSPYLTSEPIIVLAVGLTLRPRAAAAAPITALATERAAVVTVR